MSVNGGGRTPCSQLSKKIGVLFFKREKDAECSETEKYVFC